MCDGDKRKASECERGNAITSVRKRGREREREGESENTRARASTRGRELEHESEVLITQCEGERRSTRSRDEI